MNKKKIGDKLKNGLSSAVNKAKDTVGSIKKPDIKLPDIKVPEIKVPDIKAPDIKLPNIKVPDFRVPEKVKSVFGKKEKKETVDPYSLNVISTKSAIQIIYYLMVADGKIVGKEDDLFSSISTELDPEFTSHKDDILNPCIKIVETADSKEYLEAIRDGINKAIKSSARKEDSFITPKLLVWDLMSIACSDGDYDESERTIIHYISDRYGVEEAMLLEMENGILTIMDLEKELEWIKTTDRPYLEVEQMVNEIDQRRAVIFDSVKDLISL